MKRFPIGVALFTLLWALALFLPPTREISRALSTSFTLTPDSHIPTHLPNDDPLTIGWKLERAAWGATSPNATLHQMDALAARYPDQLWIPAMRLRFTVDLLPYIDPKTDELRERTGHWLDARGLERATQIAAQAGRREPDNAFWPWMEASLRFSLRQKVRGVEAMERAGKASHFDDYMQSTFRARLSLWIQHDNPSWEQKYAVWSSLPFPPLMALRMASISAAIEAAAARKRGDNLRAIEIDSALLRANQIWRHDSFVFRGCSMAEDNGFYVLNRLFNGRTKNSPININEREKRSVKLREHWIQFTRANGRSDLNQRADWLIDPSISRDESRFGYSNPFGDSEPFSLKNILGISAPFLLCWVAALSVFLALVWMFGALLSRRAKNNALPSRGQVSICANFGFWSYFGSAVVLLALSPLLATFPIFAHDNGNPPWLASLLVGVAMFPSWLLPVAFFGWKGNRRLRWVRPQQEARALLRNFGKIRVVVWLLFGISCVLVATSSQGMWDATPFQLPFSTSIAMASLICAIAMEVVRIRRSGRGLLRLRLEGETSPRSTAPFPWRFARMGAWLIALVCAVSSLVNVDAGSGASVNAEFIYFPLCVLATGAGILINRKLKPSDGFTFRLATRTAGVLALAWSVVFLFASLAAWPLRAELNRQLDRRLSMREVDWMKEQIARYPPENSGR